MKRQLFEMINPKYKISRVKRLILLGLSEFSRSLRYSWDEQKLIVLHIFDEPNGWCLMKVEAEDYLSRALVSIELNTGWKLFTDKIIQKIETLKT